MEEHRPWGFYVVLSDSDDIKVKGTSKNCFCSEIERKSVTLDGEEHPLKVGQSTFHKEAPTV